MKKLLSLFLIIILATALVGCGDSTKTKAVEQGKIALANKEYDEALSSFEIALKEDESDTKIKEIRDIIKNYKDAEEYLEKKDIEKAEKTLDDISDEYEKYPIKDDIDELRSEVTNAKVALAQEEEEKEQKEKEEKSKEEKSKEEKSKEEQANQDQTDKEIQGKADTSNTQTTQAVAGSQKSEYLQKLNTIEFQETEIRKNSDYETERVTQSYELWDDFLNEIWGVLKNQLPKNEMDNLRKVQRQWIKEKEAKQKSVYDDGGNTSSAVSWSLESTKERCKELIERYMR